MARKINLLARAISVVAMLASGALSQNELQAQHAPSVTFVNGEWFDGKSFVRRTVYSVDGLFTFRKPVRRDRTVDLAGIWIVPPFGDAHNHNIGTGVEEWDRKAIQKYLADGVFYVKIQGNLPVTDEWKKRLSLNRPDGLDVVFAQGALTASGGQPIQLVEMLFARGYYSGRSKDALKDNRYFTIDSEADLDRKWPRIFSQRSDFIKTFLWFSDEFEQRKEDNDYFGQKGLDPQLLPKIVDRAHANNLRVSTHVTNAADFHNAVAAGVDEITHLPLIGLEPITIEDARLASRQRTTVITTCAIVQTLPRAILPESSLPTVLKMQVANLKLLLENGVALAVGSDNVKDSSFKEVEYLKGLGLFDNLTLLKMWTGTTAKTIFPNRRIGELSEGSEASFLALEGNPIEDLRNVLKIRMRFKQGFEVVTPVKTGIE
ncbi:MAG: hypothetical protein QOF72_3198 [Blastocatellia bacterium]|nr:hypothetical protein [Blastocatellia bacterium]